ncbi:MAG: hypothetical protein DI537_52805 [Stutzerimonas stutzeri]|nr:MAG: hypothetical protein DI537_52805 [Stutzerimonas stutzeri]
MTDHATGIRLEIQLFRAATRNIRASFRHYDAAGIRDFPLMQITENTTDRFCRLTIEGGICWRDCEARR